MKHVPCKYAHYTQQWNSNVHYLKEQLWFSISIYIYEERQWNLKQQRYSQPLLLKRIRKVAHTSRLMMRMNGSFFPASHWNLRKEKLDAEIIK